MVSQTTDTMSYESLTPTAFLDQAAQLTATESRSSTAIRAGPTINCRLEVGDSPGALAKIARGKPIAVLHRTPMWRSKRISVCRGPEYRWSRSILVFQLRKSPISSAIVKRRS